MLNTTNQLHIHYIHVDKITDYIVQLLRIIDVHIDCLTLY